MDADNRDHYLAKLRATHRELNRLMLDSYRWNIRCELSVNNAVCVANDTRQVIGLIVTESTPIYKSDGVP